MRGAALLLGSEGRQLQYSLWTEPGRSMMHHINKSNAKKNCNSKCKAIDAAFRSQRCRTTRSSRLRWIAVTCRQVAGSDVNSRVRIGTTSQAQWLWMPAGH
jgi:hypothetical protein